MLPARADVDVDVDGGAGASLANRGFSEAASSSMSFLHIHRSFLHIHESFLHIHGSFLHIHGSFLILVLAGVIIPPAPAVPASTRISARLPRVGNTVHA